VGVKPIKLEKQVGPAIAGGVLDQGKNPHWTLPNRLNCGGKRACKGRGTKVTEDVTERGKLPFGEIGCGGKRVRGAAG